MHDEAISDSSPVLTRREAQAGCWLAVLAKRTGWPVSVTSLPGSTLVSCQTREARQLFIFWPRINRGGDCLRQHSQQSEFHHGFIGRNCHTGPWPPWQGPTIQTRKSQRSDAKHSMAPPFPHGSRRNEPTQCRRRGPSCIETQRNTTTPVPSNRQTALVQIELRFRISRLIFVGH